MATRKTEKKAGSTVYTMVAIYALWSVAANLIHPITPTIIDNLNFPSYMFGVLYAAMSSTNFLFSMFWGSAAMKLGSRTVLCISSIGYAVGQLLFGLARTPFLMVLTRMMGGAFVGGIFVCTLTYLIQFSDEQTQGRNLTLCATAGTVFSAFGYLVGGVIGNRSIPLAFVCQVGTLVLCGVLFRLCLRPDQAKRTAVQKDAPAQKRFWQEKWLLTASVLLVLSVVLITSFASTAYEQSLNYYMKAELGFKPSYNGLVKASVGMISLTTNLTVCVWMIRSRYAGRYLAGTLAAGSLFLSLMMLPLQLAPFMAVNLIFFACNAIYIPLLQNICAGLGGKEQRGLLMGAYNSLKSAGMIVGALFAGFLYEYGPKLPFLLASVLFLAGAVLVVAFLLRHRTNTDSFSAS